MTSAAQLACMTLPYARFSFERALEGIAGAGYRYVSFGGLPHQGKPTFDDGVPGESRRIGGLLKEYGLTPVTLVSTDALAVEKPIDVARRRMDFAEDIGVTELLSLGISSYRPFPSEPIPVEELRERYEAFAEKYAAVGEEAGKRGLTVTIKPHTGNTATALVVAETLAKIGSPHVKASYDPGNVRYYEGVDPAKDLPIIAGDTVSFIAKDHAGDRAEANFPIPGSGDVDFAALFSTLRENSFSGPVVVERLDGTGSADPDASTIDDIVAEARRRLASMLDKAGFGVS